MDIRRHSRAVLYSAALSAFIGAASIGQAAFATITLDQPNVAIGPGAQSLWFSGSITIHEENPGAVLMVTHAYLDGSNSIKVDVGSYAQSYFNWIGSGGSFHAGGFYNGPLFEILVEATDPYGLYWHQFGDIHSPTRVYVYQTGMDDPDHRSNVLDYSVNIVPEPMTIAVLGIGSLALIRRRRS